ncbi:hypothetical protein GCM10010439_64750 [Actinocorallia aurantiaca]|uniref:Uncharacterized protein n=1 Tax=Actinocorallia aurantiaca TaxID=46204 RepID=A0ABN3UPF4_9ACTN
MRGRKGCERSGGPSGKVHPPLWEQGRLSTGPFTRAAFTGMFDFAAATFFGGAVDLREVKVGNASVVGADEGGTGVVEASPSCDARCPLEGSPNGRPPVSMLRQLPLIPHGVGTEDLPGRQRCRRLK